MARKILNIASVALVGTLLFCITSADEHSYRYPPLAKREAEAAKGEIDFGYNGLIGPANWVQFGKNCADKEGQSPINIDPAKGEFDLKKAPHIRMTKRQDLPFFNNGKTVEVEVPAKGEDQVLFMGDGGNERFQLKQFHFHTPSEHRVNGKYFDMETHFVFQDPQEKIVVMAVMWEVEGVEDNEMLQPLAENMPEKKGDENKLAEFDFALLKTQVKNLTDAFTYGGSLTTPPCSPGVTFVINKEPFPMSVAQYKKFKGTIGFNSRFTQLAPGEKESEINKRHVHWW